MLSAWQLPQDTLSGTGSKPDLYNQGLCDCFMKRWLRWPSHWGHYYYPLDSPVRHDKKTGFDMACHGFEHTTMSNHARSCSFHTLASVCVAVCSDANDCFPGTFGSVYSCCTAVVQVHIRTEFSTVMFVLLYAHSWTA